jgi:hypothetical protein
MPRRSNKAKRNEMLQSSVLGKLGQSLLLLAMLSTASACAKPGETFATFPPAEDVRVELKPVPSLETLESEEAGNLYESLLESWGERGWLTVQRVCDDAVRKGAVYPPDWCRPPQ